MSFKENFNTRSHQLYIIMFLMVEQCFFYYHLPLILIVFQLNLFTMKMIMIKENCNLLAERKFMI